MTDPTDSGAADARRRRLRFRSWHRGTREADFLLGGFADRHLAGFDDGQLERYERLLEESEADLWDWIVGREPIPSAADSDVLRLLISSTQSATPS